MKNKTLWKDIKKCFLKSKGRFFSIMCLIAIGSFALVGLQVAGPDMRKTGENYFNQLHLADISVIGDYGIDKENQTAINKISGAEKIEYGYLKDVVISDSNTSIRVFSATNGISEYEVVSGRMPESENEVAIASFFSDEYKIGDTISFTEKADVAGDTVLKNNKLKIVGFVNSSELLSIINMGQSTAGTGELQGYAVVTPKAFDSDVYMIARLSFKDTEGVDPYSNEYTKLVQAHKDELDALLADQPNLRLTSIKNEYQEKIDDAQSQIDDAKKELSDALEKLEDGESELSDAKQKYADGLSEYETQKADAEKQLKNAEKELVSAAKKISEGESQLSEAKKKYENGLSEYKTQKATAEKQLKEAEQKLNSAKQEISNGETELAEKKQELSDAKTALQKARKTLDTNWAEYNKKLAQLETLKNSKAQLDSAQKELDIQIAKAESATGMTISEIEDSLPEMKTQLDSSKSQYEMLSQLFDIKTQRDSTIGSPMYVILDTKYQIALKTAGLTEETANALYAQLDTMQTQINEAETQYNQLCKLVETKHTLDEKWAEYNTASEQAQGAEEQLSAAKAELEKGEKEYSEKETEIASADKQISAAEEQLKNAKKEYQTGLSEYNTKKSEANTKLSAAKQELDSAAKKISDNENELNIAKKKYSDGQIEYKNKKSEANKKLSDAKNELNKASTKISDNEAELADGWKEYNEKKPDAEKDISDAEEKVAEAQDKLNSLKSPVYAMDTRREVPGSEGYRIYSTVSNIIDALANIFPIFLYFVAALVTLTTMTRFVDEERINSGTLKALGYSNKDIIKKFVVYGFTASMIGAIIGIIAGHILLPKIVYNAYGHSFTYPSIELHFYPVISIVALILAFLCAVVPAFIVSKKELKERPSALLQPKPPEAGSKIFLERITPIWNRMSFTHKVTARNIFRYKKRMLMTIFGVCGSVTLIFAGFSVQHSISGIKARQFGEIMKYDLIVAQNEGINEKQQNEITKLLSDDSVDSYIPIHYESVTKVAGKNEDKQEIKLIAPENSDALQKYITLVNRSSHIEIQLSDDGCVISERLAKLLNVGIGDTFEITDSENNIQTVKVSDITEMYTGHFIFMNSNYYKTVFYKDYNANANLVKLNDRSTDNANEQASRFIELDGVKGVVQNTTLMNQIDTIVLSLNNIMTILIIVAILLAVVILYNLTNINVSERIRELSTIKVLGFYNNEVTMYIYRETIILTLLGILLGFGLGDALYLYIISIVPPDEVMFNPALGLKAFVVPTIVILVITVVLGIIINRRLKNVDMLEALKSVE